MTGAVPCAFRNGAIEQEKTCFLDVVFAFYQLYFTVSNSAEGNRYLFVLNARLLELMSQVYCRLQIIECQTSRLPGWIKLG